MSKDTNKSGNRLLEIELLGAVLFAGLVLIPATALGQTENQTETVCPAIAIEPQLKTDKKSYKVGEDIIVSGKFWTGSISGTQEVNLELGSDREDEFGDLDLEAILFIEAQPGDCGFTFEFHLQEQFQPTEDLHAAKWTLFADYEGMTAEASFEVVEENVIIIPGPERPEQEGKKITLPGSASIRLIGLGAEQCEEPLKAAFERLYAPKEREYYNFVVRWTSTIQCLNEPDGSMGSNPWENDKRIVLPPIAYSNEVHYEWTGGSPLYPEIIAGVLVHEAFHEYQCTELIKASPCWEDWDGPFREGEAGLYQIESRVAMNKSEDRTHNVSLEECYGWIKNIYDNYWFKEATDEVFTEYCGKAPTTPVVTEEIDPEIVPDANVTILDQEPMQEKEPEMEEQQTSDRNSISANWLIELWQWIRGMINSMLGSRS